MAEGSPQQTSTELDASSPDALRARCAALESEAHRLRQIVEQAPFLVHVHEGPNHVTTYKNPASIARSGSQLGVPVRDRADGRDLGAVLEALDRVRADGLARELLPVSVDLEHGPVVVRAFIAPLRDDEGAVRGAISYAYDARTELVAQELAAHERAARAVAESELERSRARALRELADTERAAREAVERALAAEQEARAEAEQAARLAELFVGVLGHDLRGPLTAVMLHAERLRRASRDPRVLDAARHIVASSARMGSLVAQLLDVTRIRLGGGLEPRAVPVDLSVLTAAIADEVRASTDAPIDVRADGDVVGSWDRTLLGQAFGNLLSNAVQHRTGGGVAVHLDGTAPDRVAVAVHNEGAIPPELLPRIFDPFRTSGDRDDGRDRLGLGLYITRAVAEAHGGSVTCDSSPAAGTTFRLVVPRHLGEPRQ